MSGEVIRITTLLFRGGQSKQIWGKGSAETFGGGGGEGAVKNNHIVLKCICPAKEIREIGYRDHRSRECYRQWKSSRDCFVLGGGSNIMKASSQVTLYIIEA